MISLLRMIYIRKYIFDKKIWRITIIKNFKKEKEKRERWKILIQISKILILVAKSTEIHMFEPQISYLAIINFTNWVKGVHQNSKTNPPTQTTRADSTPMTVGDRSSPPKTDLGRSNGGFSSPKLDELDSSDETHERRLNLPRSI